MPLIGRTPVRGGEAIDRACDGHCIAGALTRQRYTELLIAAGFVEIELTDSHVVQDGFWSVIVRARKS